MANQRMKTKKYPRVGQFWSAKPQGLCCVCDGVKSDSRVAVQMDYFRGNDIVLKIHSDCIKDVTPSILIEKAEYKELEATPDEVVEN